MTNREAIGTGIGKIILLGEHSVVYGKPAIAIPFSNTKVEAIIKKTNGDVTLDCVFFRGLLSNAPERILGTKTVIEKVVEDLDKELRDFHIEINSTIPYESGMGSSAAVAVATIRGLYRFFGESITNDRLIDLTNISEKIVHGNPSGIDTSVIVMETNLYYVKGKQLDPFHFKLDAYLIVAHTGSQSQTKDAVRDVRLLIEKNPKKYRPIIDELGNIAYRGKRAMEGNNPIELGNLMTRAHFLLDKLSVSNEKLNKLVDISLDNGALGAKLTGGGRGGSMIALCSTKDEAKYISNKLLDKGAKKVWVSNMGVDM